MCLPTSPRPALRRWYRAFTAPSAAYGGGEHAPTRTTRKRFISKLEIRQRIATIRKDRRTHDVSDRTGGEQKGGRPTDEPWYRYDCFILRCLCRGEPSSFAGRPAGRPPPKRDHNEATKGRNTRTAEGTKLGTFESRDMRNSEYNLEFWRPLLHESRAHTTLQHIHAPPPPTTALEDKRTELHQNTPPFLSSPLPRAYLGENAVPGESGEDGELHGQGAGARQ